jgi:predicted Zn-dependent protease
LKVSEAVRDQAERIGELSSRKLAEFPLDPALHYEMGKLLLQTGRTEVGLQWLNTALRLDPAHRPTHLLLAEYHGTTGNAAQAEYHRRIAQGGAADKE